MEKATLAFLIYKIRQILKRCAGTFRRAQTLKLGGVYLHKKIVDDESAEIELFHYKTGWLFCLVGFFV